MDGIWYRHCPLCGEYIKLSESQKGWTCACCGWQDTDAAYYCDVAHKYCPFYQLAEEHCRYPFDLIR